VPAWLVTFPAAHEAENERFVNLCKKILNCAKALPHFRFTSFSCLSLGGARAYSAMRGGARL